MKFFKNTLPLLLGMLLIAGSAVAQVQQQQQQQQQIDPDSITEEELEQFAQVSQESQKVQEEMRNQVDSLLDEKDMEMERFRQIMMSQRNPQSADSADITEEEQATMEEIQPQLMQMQQQAQQEMVTIIQDNGLEPQRFQQLMQAVRTNPEVMKRFQDISGNGGGNGNMQ